MWFRRLLLVSIFGVSVVWPAAGMTEPSPCVAAYEKAQEHRSDGRLRAARAQLKLCVAAACSDFVRSDCSRWLGEVESALPSLVLAVRAQGKDVDDVQVFFDGELLVNRLDGKAVPVDVGRHKLKLVRVGTEPANLELTIREGEKNRLVTVDLGGPEAKPQRPVEPIAATPAAAGTPSRGWLPYALGGVGILGIAGFAVLGAMGNSEKSERETTCAPDCSDADVAAVRTKYHLADVSLGVGVVALGVATYLYLAAPTKVGPEPSRAKKLGVDVHLLPNGGFAAIGAPF